MQNCTTILGIIDMRQRGISYDDCRSRYHIGCSTISLIMSRFHACGKDLDTLKQMSAEEVEYLFSFHRKIYAEKMIPSCRIIRWYMTD